jgi:hypothetical protein
MAASPPLDIAYQTLYSELVQRCLDETFASEFSPDGRFVAVSIKEKKYWYFDTPKPEGGAQSRRYVGPADDTEITKRVEAFKNIKANLKGRQRLVATLTRQAHLSRPLLKVGQVTDELAKAGLFRLRGVLVGTAAYQCYPAVLGRRLEASAMQTGDADFAQFHDVSVAIGDSLPPIMDVLRRVDPTFRDIPSQIDGRLSSRFASRDDFKVEFLTPNRGSDDHGGRPVQMPALGGAAAAPLRFLDYLIYQPIRAVMLHGAGVPVFVPSPERYAVHKLIIASRREDRDKAAKDRLQARSIFEAMVANRQHADLASAFTEAWDRGEHWRTEISKSIASYADDFQRALRSELARGISEIGSDPADYGLDVKIENGETPSGSSGPS